MTSPRIDSYLAALSHELEQRGIAAETLLDESRDHLADAIEDAQDRGLSRDAAEHEATVRFGPPALVAERYALGKSRRLNRVVFALAIVAGIAIAYVDSRPHWDDAGITVFAMVTAAAIFGVVAPRKPAPWALAFPLAGAYAGAFVRRAITS